jgi:uncharacterized protein (TIGR03382 family)
MRTLPLIIVIACAVPVHAEEICWDDIAPGVDWCVFGEGNLQEEVHWARVDLTVPELYIRVTRDEEGPLTASQEAAQKQSTVTINGDWDSASYNGPQGLSVGGGWYFEGSQDWDNDNPAGDWSFLACDANKQCRINPPNVLEQWTWNEINVVGGNGQRLVIDGVLQAPSYDSCTRPRSGVCLDATGEIMTFFVAEGDNSCGSSTGWTPSDFAQFVFDHGCYNGLMLDGGGSSDLVINQVHVTDRPPTEPAERSTHSHLSIIHQPAPVDPLCADLMNGKRCQGDTLITCQGGAAESGDCSLFGSACEESDGTAYCTLALPGFCPNGANTDSCTDESVMSRCSLGQPTAFDCASIFGASCEDYGTGARCIQYGCIYGGDASWCDAEVAKTCTPDNSGDLNISYLTESDCAAQGEACQDGACITTDVDADGYPSEAYGGTDCDDANGLVNPGASESCNDIDDDCDGQIDEGAVDAPTWYLDIDGDGYGNPNEILVACTQPPAYVAVGTDCNDTDFETHPGHEETCNLADDDCDAQIDEDATNISTFYLDIDGDGFGDPLSSKQDCFASDSWVADDTDCNDTDFETHPGHEETCNLADDDCDAQIDEDATNISTFYLDSDGDGFGDPLSSKQDCFASDTWVADDTDCDDSTPSVHPEATETPDDDVDQDCDGEDLVTADIPEPPDATVADEDADSSSNDTADPGPQDTAEPGPQDTAEPGPQDTAEPDAQGESAQDSAMEVGDEDAIDDAAATTVTPSEPPTNDRPGSGSGGLLPGTSPDPVEVESEGCQSVPASPMPMLSILLLLLARVIRRRLHVSPR